MTQCVDFVFFPLMTQRSYSGNFLCVSLTFFLIPSWNKDAVAGSGCSAQPDVSCVCFGEVTTWITICFKDPTVWHGRIRSYSDSFRRTPVHPEVCEVLLTMRDHFRGMACGVHYIKSVEDKISGYVRVAFIDISYVWLHVRQRNLILVCKRLTGITECMRWPGVCPKGPLTLGGVKVWPYHVTPRLKWSSMTSLCTCTGTTGTFTGLTHPHIPQTLIPHPVKSEIILNLHPKPGFDC